LFLAALVRQHLRGSLASRREKLFKKARHTVRLFQRAAVPALRNLLQPRGLDKFGDALGMSGRSGSVIDTDDDESGDTDSTNLITHRSAISHGQHGLTDGGA
jgi:hypothetical protein